MGLIDDLSALLAFITPGYGLYEVKSSLIRNVQITEDGFTVQDKVFNNFWSYTQLQYAYTFSGLLIFSIGYGIPGYACKHADPFQHVHEAVLQSWDACQPKI